LRGEKVAIHSTTHEANAAMKTSVRKGTVEERHTLIQAFSSTQASRLSDVRAASDQKHA
jgi:hypothetical protein